MKFKLETFSVTIEAYSYGEEGESDFKLNLSTEKDESLPSFVKRVENIIKEFVKEEE